MANLDTPATRGLGDKIVDAASNGKDWLVNTISGNDATASAEAATNSASSVVDANNLTAIFDQIKGAIDYNQFTIQIYTHTSFVLRFISIWMIALGLIIAVLGGVLPNTLVWNSRYFWLFYIMNKLSEKWNSKRGVLS